MMITPPTVQVSRFAAIIAAARAKKQEESLEKIEVPATQLTEISQAVGTIDSMRAASYLSSTDKYGNEITYNEKQSEFVSLAASGRSCILIGAAGTGKTTAMKGTVQSLIQNSRTGILQNHDHKHLPHGVPGIVVCAYTRRATNNIRRNMDEGMKGNCLTIHKLLEYAPVYYEVVGQDGEMKTTMKFEPTRSYANPLPQEITTVIFEESSMIGTSLYAEFLAALQHTVQIIFLGDIQQLPPVFGPAILGFKMLELPTIELTEVYRQALESPIIRLAHRILSGRIIPASELGEWNVPGLSVKPWKKKIEAESALSVSEKLFAKLYEDGSYNPLEDIILIPFNKGYGTLELNKSIANHIARKHERVVWEVVSGFVKHYFAVGDKVLYDREDAVILEIYPNPAYTGIPAQPESTYLDYWGHNNTPTSLTKSWNQDSQADDDIDFLLAQVATAEEDRVTQSSHCIKLLMTDSDSEKLVTKAAEINTLILGYCLTIHKSQGSEWDKVFLLLHNSHATMISRELVYTAVTRAKKELFVICEDDTLVKGIRSQRIKGNTLAEKAIYFQGKSDRGDAQT